MATPYGSGGFVADIPPAPGELSAIKLRNPVPAPVVGSKVHIKGAIVGAGFTPSEFPGSVAKLGIMLHRRGDNLSAAGVFEHFRQYSEWNIPVVAGEFDATIPLMPDVFFNVLGRKDAAGFSGAIAELEGVVVTLGHDSGRAHGVYADPGSQLQVYLFEIIP